MGENSATDPPPRPPSEPEPADCCGGGCARCVFDIYDDALARHRLALAAWTARQADTAGMPPAG